MSDRSSALVPRITSGAANNGVPAARSLGTDPRSPNVASPKSVTLHRPWRDSIRLAGLMSRWVMPAWCPAASASAASAISRHARPGSIGPPASTSSLRLPPSSSSMAM